jgi:hypothetical protein
MSIARSYEAGSPFSAKDEHENLHNLNRSRVPLSLLLLRIETISKWRSNREMAQTGYGNANAIRYLEVQRI